MLPNALNEKDAAKFLGFAVQSLRNRRCQRLRPPYVKLGSRVVYLPSDLADFLKEHRIDPEARGEVGSGKD